MTSTALLVPVPRLAPLIEPWASRHDPAFASGLPTHVTIQFPFLPPEQLTPSALATLTDVAASVPATSVEFAEVGMFPDGEVLHLLPRPDEVFRTLGRRLRDHWPDLLPYGGRHPDPTPHVTVGHEIPRARARHAARALMLAMPVRVPIHVVQVWAGNGDGTWGRLATFRLGEPNRAAA
jgi:2'-5' RNA ligase